MKRVCPTCKTTKFRKTSDSGFVCKYGHKILGVQAEEQEDGMAVMGGRERKRVKILQDNQHETSPAQQKSDFLRIIQLSLQVFARCMIQDLNFPPELEPVIRELWILYLANSKTHTIDAYLFEANVKEKESYSKAKADEDEEFTLDDQVGFSDSEGSEDDIPVKLKGTVQVKWPALVYADTLVLIYLACIYLNYPILTNDLLRWCHTRQLPYLKMQSRIPSNVLARLNLRLSESMTTVPSFTTLLERSNTFSRCFIVNCNMEFPPLNIPLYLDRFCTQFFLPVEGYYYANYILQCYRQNNHFDVSNSFSFKLQPATILMACVVTAAKFIYGVEEFDMSHASQYDITTTKQAWVDLVRKNIAQWENIQKGNNQLDSIIKYLRDNSYATKASVHDKDRSNVILNVLMKGPVRPVRYQDSNRFDMWMDTDELMTKDSVHDENPPLIQEGEFYYAYRDGFQPEIYLDLIKLAMLVTGESTTRALNRILKKIDVGFMRSKASKAIDKEELDARYGVIKDE